MPCIVFCSFLQVSFGDFRVHSLHMNVWRVRCPLWWNNMPDLCSSSNLCNRATTHTKWKKLISVHKLTQISVLIFFICLLYEDLLSKLYTHCRIQQNATMCTALLHEIWTSPEADISRVRIERVSILYNKLYVYFLILANQRPWF